MQRMQILMAGILGLSVSLLNASTVKAQNAESTTSTNTSTTTTTAVAKPESKLKMSYTVVLEADKTAIDTKTAPLQSTHILGGVYKLSEDSSFEARQYLTYTAWAPLGDDGSNPNGAVLGYQRLLYNKKFNAIGNSEKIPFQIGYNLPTSKAMRDAHSVGSIPAYAEIDWTLSPKIAVGYIVTPMLSMNESPASWGSAFAHTGAFYYTQNDNLTAYVNLGQSAKWSNADIYNTTEERANIALGAVYIAGKLVINPEISNSMLLKGGKPGQKFAQATPFRSEETGYALTAVVGF